MKNVINFLLVMLMAVGLVSCSSSKSTVSRHVDLAGYRYASVINNDTYRIPAQLMEYEIQLYDAVADSRLEMVSDMRIYELTQSQQSALLLVKYAVDIRQEETVVTVNFIDFNTGRPVASCSGKYSTLGINGNADIKGAIKQVAKQIALTFPQ